MELSRSDFMKKAVAGPTAAGAADPLNGITKADFSRVGNLFQPLAALAPRRRSGREAPMPRLRCAGWRSEARAVRSAPPPPTVCRPGGHPAASATSSRTP